MIFLDALALGGNSVSSSGAIGAGLMALGIGLVFLIFAMAIGFQIFVSFAYMSIAKKIGKTSPTGIAWIPGIGPLIVAWHSSGMHWWPWLLFIGFFIPFLNFVAIPVLGVFTIIWTWKMYVALGRPGWWSLVSLLAIVGILLNFVSGLIGMVVYIIGIALSLILLGKAAWGKGSASTTKVETQN